MKKKLKGPDPLGEKPAPVTGALEPLYLDDERRELSQAASAAFATIWIKHEAQEIIIAQIRKYLNDWNNRDDDASGSGRRLSQLSQAGKSAAMKRLKRILADEGARRGLPPNEYEVVIVLLKRRTTLKGLYQAILKKMGDPHWDQEKVSASTLLKRIEEHSHKVGMKLLVVDEVQHLDSLTKDAKEVLDQLKVFVDEAYFPVVFVGDEDSELFFKRNPKFAARLGSPLKLEPLDVLGDDGDALAFRQFCHRFDQALVRSGAISKLAGLKEEHLLNGLIVASGGHVGRVARLLEEAVPFSVWRGAASVEAYDLSHAVRTYAMDNEWVDHDPFSKLAALA